MSNSTSDRPAAAPSVRSEAARGAWARRQARVGVQQERWDAPHQARVRERQEELAAKIADQARPTPRNFWRRLTSSRSLTTLLVFTGLLALGVVPAVLALRQTNEEGIAPEVIRRIQIGLQQISDLDGEGFDLIEIVNGGELLSISSTSQGDYGPTRLHDGQFHPQFTAWRSAGLDLPLEATFRVRFRTPLQKVVIWNHPDEPQASYIREFEVLASLDDPRTNPDAMVLVGRFTAPAPRPKLVFTIETPLPVRYATIRVLSTFGAADYVSAAEVGLFAPSRDPEQIPVPRPPGPVPI